MSKLTDALQTRKDGGFKLQVAAAQPQTSTPAPAVVSGNPLMAALYAEPAKPQMQTPAITTPAVPVMPSILGNMQQSQPLTTQNVLDVALDLSFDVMGRHANGANIGPIDTSTLQGQYNKHIEMVATALKLGDVSEAMLRCMQFIEENIEQLEHEKLILDEDIGLLVRSLQQSNGVVIAKKTENKQKRKTTSAEVDSVANELAALGLKF